MTAKTRADAVRPIRLPLQTGGGRLGWLLWMSASAGATFLSACLALPFVRHRAPGDSWLMTAIPVLITVGFGGFTLRLRSESRKERASDVEVGPRELRFVGGPLEGEAIPWTGIEHCTITTDRSRSVQTLVNDVVVSTEYLDQLWIRTRGESGPTDLLLAESLDREEKLSLEELRQSILGACETRGGQAVEPASARPPSARVLQCPACGCPVSPSDALATVCPSLVAFAV